MATIARTIKTVKVQFNSANNNYIRLDKIGFLINDDTVSIPSDAVFSASSSQENDIAEDGTTVLRTYVPDNCRLTGGSYWQSPIDGVLPAYVQIDFPTPIQIDELFLVRHTDANGRASSITITVTDSVLVEGKDVVTTIYSGPVDFNASQSIAFVVPKKKTDITAEEQAELDALALINERAKQADSLSQEEVIKLLINDIDDAPTVLNLLDSGAGYVELTAKKTAGGAELTATKARYVLAVYHMNIPSNTIEKQQFRESIESLSDGDFYELLTLMAADAGDAEQTGAQSLITKSALITLMARNFGTADEELRTRIKAMVTSASDN